MLRYIYHALVHFRSVFSRRSSGLVFCSVVLSFMAVPELMGVTSMCRFWGVGESDYHRLLHFF